MYRHRGRRLTDGLLAAADVVDVEEGGASGGRKGRWDADIINDIGSFPKRSSTRFVQYCWKLHLSVHCFLRLTVLEGSSNGVQRSEDNKTRLVYNTQVNLTLPPNIPITNSPECTSLWNATPCTYAPYNWRLALSNGPSF